MLCTKPHRGRTGQRQQHRSGNRAQEIVLVTVLHELDQRMLISLIASHFGSRWKRAPPHGPKPSMPHPAFIATAARKETVASGKTFGVRRIVFLPAGKRLDAGRGVSRKSWPGLPILWPRCRTNANTEGPRSEMGGARDFHGINAEREPFERGQHLIPPRPIALHCRPTCTSPMPLDRSGTEGDRHGLRRVEPDCGHL